jgi:mono/diheme cytochrome c family protein
VEILHDLRARRRAVRSRSGFLPLIAALACAGGARDSETADTAVLQGASADTIRYSTGREVVPPDSASIPASTDSAGHAPASVMVLAADSAAGDSLYQRKGRCLTCHGTDARGLPSLGVNLRDDEWLHSDGSPAGIAASIATGVARPKQAQIRMPAFASQLTGAEIDRLAAYVYAISHHDVTTTSDAVAEDRDSTYLPPDSLQR